MSGATDTDACTNKRYYNCQCYPKCVICGNGEHSAIHGPFYGQPPGSKPYEHEFQPRASTCPHTNLPRPERPYLDFSVCPDCGENIKLSTGQPLAAAAPGEEGGE